MSSVTNQSIQPNNPQAISNYMQALNNVGAGSNNAQLTNMTPPAPANNVPAPGSVQMPFNNGTANPSYSTQTIGNGGFGIPTFMQPNNYGNGIVNYNPNPFLQQMFNGNTGVNSMANYLQALNMPSNAPTRNNGIVNTQFVPNLGTLYNPSIQRNPNIGVNPSVQTIYQPPVTYNPAALATISKANPLNGSNITTLSATQPSTLQSVSIPPVTKPTAITAPIKPLDGSNPVVSPSVLGNITKPANIVGNPGPVGKIDPVTGSILTGNNPVTQPPTTNAPVTQPPNVLPSTSSNPVVLGSTIYNPVVRPTYNTNYSTGFGTGVTLSPSLLASLYGNSSLAVSDETSKTNIKETSSAEKFLNALGNHEYIYKNPKHGDGTPGKKYYSPMAQEFEKAGPVGKSMVITGPDGLKRVDYARGEGIQWAALAHMNKEMQKMKLQMLKNKKGKK